MGPCLWLAKYCHDVEWLSGGVLNKKLYLGLVPHGALASNHDLAAGFLLQLFGGHAAGAQDSAHEVELHTKRDKLGHEKEEKK